MNTEAFNFNEILSIGSNSDLKQSDFLKVSDGEKLAYYEFLPAFEPKATLIFYHGGGIWSNGLYHLSGYG